MGEMETWWAPGPSCARSKESVTAKQGPTNSHLTVLSLAGASGEPLPHLTKHVSYMQSIRSP